MIDELDLSFRLRLLLAATCIAFFSPANAGAAANVPPSTERRYEIANFQTEGGATLPVAVVRYGTYGKLNAARDNAVLVPSHAMADYHGYEWLIGKGQALDPDRDFIVATEMFGNGHSSSPSNTPAPFDGPRFPRISIRDNVNAAHKLLVDELGIHHLRAVVGFSMGAQQAFQWAVSYPDFADRIVATAGTARTYEHGIVRLQSQIDAVATDPAFQGGNYTHQPVAGMHASAIVWAAWLYSQEWWRQGLWRKEAEPGTTFEQFMNDVHKMFDEFDANDFLLQCRAWQDHDVGRTPGVTGGTAGALASIRVPVLYMPSTTDLYFPLGDAQFEMKSLRHARLVPINSLWGHEAGGGTDPEDRKFLNEQIGRFLQEKKADTP